MHLTLISLLYALKSWKIKVNTVYIDDCSGDEVVFPRHSMCESTTKYYASPDACKDAYKVERVIPLRRTK